MFYKGSSFLLITAFMMILQSCELFNPTEQIPAYIHIDKFNVTTLSSQGSNSSRITDAWVYIDDEPIGAFELPATIPVLYEGQHEITLMAGIKVDGIASTRAIYPFYESYIINTSLFPDSVITLSPTVTYSSAANFLWLEAFEDGGVTIQKTSNSDTLVEKTSQNGEVFEGSYSGVIHLDAAHPYFEGKSIDEFILQGGTSPTFLELNYKCNNEVCVGLYANSSSIVMKLDKMCLFPTDTWTKIYINLNSTVNLAYSPDNFQVFFAASKSDDVSEVTILLDNIKLIRR